MLCTFMSISPFILVVTTDCRGRCPHPIRQFNAGHWAGGSWSWTAVSICSSLWPCITILTMTRKGICETVVLLKYPTRKEQRNLKLLQEKMTSCLALRQSKGEIHSSILKPILIGLLSMICCRQNGRIIENGIIVVSILEPQGSCWTLTACLALWHSKRKVSHAPRQPRNSHYSAARCNYLCK